jgi:hypothetical protein
MSDLRKAAEMALEALESVYGKGKRCEAAIKELRQALAEPDEVLAEREACAKVAESYEPTCDSCPRGVAIAIRARGIDGATVGEVGVWGEEKNN